MISLVGEDELEVRSCYEIGDPCLSLTATI